MTVETVKAGLAIRVTQADGRAGQVQVKAACKNKSNGHWYCVSHQEGFPNNFDKDTHIRTGAHEMVWICHEHGAEAP